MVMPDVICVPNNNKAIHNLNMCFFASAYMRGRKKRSLSLFALTPSANFRHYLIEKVFLLFVLSSPSPCFHNILRVDDVFHAIFTGAEGWCCSWAHYCSYYYSFLSLLTPRLGAQQKQMIYGREDMLDARRNRFSSFFHFNPCVWCRYVFSYALMMMTWEYTLLRTKITCMSFLLLKFICEST